MSRDDLSGRWTGIFNYPDALPATSFTAIIQDAAGTLSGEISESRHDGAAIIGASIHGRRQDSRVTFIKLYDALDGEYDEVAYTGEVDGSGQEIGGRWEIARIWSGSFIMVRDRTDEIAEAIETARTADRYVPVASDAERSPPPERWGGERSRS